MLTTGVRTLPPRSKVQWSGACPAAALARRSVSDGSRLPVEKAFDKRAGIPIVSTPPPDIQRRPRRPPRNPRVVQCAVRRSTADTPRTFQPRTSPARRSFGGSNGPAQQYGAAFPRRKGCVLSGDLSCSEHALQVLNVALRLAGMFDLPGYLPLRVQYGGVVSATEVLSHLCQ